MRTVCVVKIMSKPEGYCRLCGDRKVLTQEHIPPKAAFNHERRVFETMQDALRLSGQKHSIFQGGIQKTTLCESCNNKTGNWYAKAFVEWSKQGFIFLDKIESNLPLELPFDIMPL